jgi:hypothetical protein
MVVVVASRVAGINRIDLGYVDRIAVLPNVAFRDATISHV